MNRISNSFVMLLALVACGEAPDISDGPDPASPVEDAHDPTPPRDGLVDGLDVAPEHGVRDADSAQERAQRRFDGDWFGVADCDGAWLDVRLVVASDWEGVDALIAIDGELDVLYGEAEGREVALRSSQRTPGGPPGAVILLYRGPGADQLEADLQLGGGDCLGILRPVGKRGRDGRTDSGS